MQLLEDGAIGLVEDHAEAGHADAEAAGEGMGLTAFIEKSYPRD